MYIASSSSPVKAHVVVLGPFGRAPRILRRLDRPRNLVPPPLLLAGGCFAFLGLVNVSQMVVSINLGLFFKSFNMRVVVLWGLS